MIAMTSRGNDDDMMLAGIVGGGLVGWAVGGAVGAVIGAVVGAVLAEGESKKRRREFNPPTQETQ